MELKVIKKDKDKVEFLVKDSDSVTINTFRRLVLDAVPAMAIEDVTVKKNSSALYDEVLAHRLGQVILSTDLKSHNLPSECKCKGKGCSMCQVHMSLKAKGPAIVYAEEIKSKDPKIEAVYAKTPIVELLEGQEIDLDMVAILGQGKDHSKFSPGLLNFREYPIIKISSVQNTNEVEAVCPKKVFEVSSGKLKVKNLEACDLCEACVEKCKPKDGISVEGSKSDFIVTLETWGQLKANEIMESTIDRFDKKLDELAKLVKGLK